MRQVQPHLIWIGNGGDVRNIPALFHEQIEAVVDLADNEAAATLPRDIAYCRFPIADGDGADGPMIRIAIATVAEMIRQGIRSLVCCSAGMSRSPAIAAAAIARVTGVAAHECLVQITRTGPIDLSPGLWKRVLDAIE